MTTIWEILEKTAIPDIAATVRDAALDFKDYLPSFTSDYDGVEEEDDPQDPDGMLLLKTPYRPPKISSTLENYSYPPMANGKENIRLILLYPGVGLDDMSISLDEFPIDCEPEFEAISYQWGDPSLCRVIQCNGKVMHITENLFAALSHFRRSKTARSLWADAVCINQGDNVEKSNQIQLMEKIYSNSKNVLGWLGYTTPSLPRGVSLMHELLKYHGKDGGKGQFLNSTTRAAHLAKQRDFDALGFILSRPWYRRLWVQQEIVLSTSFDLHYGPDVAISAETIFAVCQCIFEREDQFLKDHLHQKARAGLLHIIGLEKMRLQSRQRDLHFVLTTVRPCLATDPRDKIFGILSLCHANSRGDIKPDYEKSVQQTYIQATKYILQADPAPSDVFDSLGGTSAGLPSWVPDWSQTQPPGTKIGRFGRFAAGGTKRFKPTILESNGKSIMVARGRCVESLTLLCDLNDFITTTIINHGKFYREHEQVFMRKLIRKIMEFVKKANLKTRNEAWLAVRAGTSFKGRDPDKPSGQSSDGVPQWWKTWKAYSQGDVKYTGLKLNDGYTTAYPHKLEHSPPLSFLKQVMIGRKFVLTDCGNLGWVPGSASNNDVVAVLEGSKFPLLLRRGGPNDAWRIIGTCYVHGIMYGEAWEGFEAQVEDIMIE